MPSRMKIVAALALLAFQTSSALAAVSADSTTRRPTPGALSPAGAMADQLAALGLPRYAEPEAYTVELSVETDGQHVAMTRFVDHGRMRTEMSSGGHDVVMIELGDDRGTSYTLMPADKRAIKQSRAAIQEVAGPAAQRLRREHETTQASSSSFRVEDLGDATVGGRAARKVRFVADQGSVLGWFDKATGAPARLESRSEGHSSAMEWKNLTIAPQPAALFEIPKGYEVTDMDAMMAQMRSMSAGGRVGVPGGVTGGLSGMAEGRAQNFGQQMGGRFGAGLGASLGGPLGAIAGQYIGGRLGGMLGKKAADAVLPGR